MPFSGPKDALSADFTLEYDFLSVISEVRKTCVKKTYWLLLILGAICIYLDDRMQSRASTLCVFCLLVFTGHGVGKQVEQLDGSSNTGPNSVGP